MRSSILAGVSHVTLSPRTDERGQLTEVFRSDWIPDFQAVQWNVVRSVRSTLRGVHCHVEHTDYLTMIDGSMMLGLYDLRPGSPTEGLGELLALDAAMSSVRIPPGVAHGFYFEHAATLLYGVSHEWNPADEFGCRFDDPELGLAWPSSEPLLSPRDEQGGSLSELRHLVQAAFATLDS
jgi:dTDP-4-dehydrorhamnose 3,5-epimerase